MIVVEDDQDVQLLIESAFSLDSRFALAGVAATAEDALEMVRKNPPGTIVLDHGLEGRLTGLQAAPMFKDVSPQSKIIFFTAREELRAAASAEPAIDAFVLKTDSNLLLRVAQGLLGMAGSAN